MNWIWNAHCSLLNRSDVKEVFGTLIASAHIPEVTFATLLSPSVPISLIKVWVLTEQGLGFIHLSLSFARNKKRKKVKRVRKKWKQWAWRKEARNVNKSVCKAILINVAGDHGKLSIIYQLNKMVMSVKTLASQREANSQKMEGYFKCTVVNASKMQIA